MNPRPTTQSAEDKLETKFTTPAFLKEKTHELQYINQAKSMNPNEEITPEEIQSALNALSLPSPTQLTVNIARKHFKAGTYHVVTSEQIRKLTADLRAKNQAAKRQDPS